MSGALSRRGFLAGSLLSSSALGSSSSVPVNPSSQKPAGSLPQGRIGGLRISRLLLGGNLLTHYTHSRDLRYVYSLAAEYNTPEKIMDTLALAEDHGVNTLVIHTVPQALEILQAHRKRGGKMQWIICTTAPVDETMEAYGRGVRQLVDMGTDAVYLWGVHGDALASRGRVDLIARAVELGREAGVPSGVGAHDVNVVVQCEHGEVNADFYIKTLHHLEYPTAPRPEEIKAATAEVPGYWCADPQMVIEVMEKVERPWIAFKVMAAGAIPPQDAFRYAFTRGADHIVAGMFDFEIAADAEIVRGLLGGLGQRRRPWRS